MKIYEGHLEKGVFTPDSDSAVMPRGRFRVRVEMLEEPAEEEVYMDEEVLNDHARAWKEFFEAMDAIEDEEIPENFPRVNFAREIEL